MAMAARVLLAGMCAALSLSGRGSRVAASDVTLKLDLAAFDLAALSQGRPGGGGGSMSLNGLLKPDAAGNAVIVGIDNKPGLVNEVLLEISTMISIPPSVGNMSIDKLGMRWSSPAALAYSFTVERIDSGSYLATDIMAPPTLSVPTSGRLPTTETAISATLPCMATGELIVAFIFQFCEDPAATWDRARGRAGDCSQGGVQAVTAQLKKACGGDDVLPAFCAAADSPAASVGGAATPVTLFNLNVAEGTGIDRSMLQVKGSAIAKVVAEGGYNVATFQEVWDAGERTTLVDGLAKAGLTYNVSDRIAGLLIVSAFPIVRCYGAKFQADTFDGSTEMFSGKGVLGALLDTGAGALLYAFTTHVAAFSGLSSKAKQVAAMRATMGRAVASASSRYALKSVAVVATGDFNMNAADPAAYKALLEGLGGAGSVRDLHVEEHGGWVAWRNASKIRGTSMNCPPGKVVNVSARWVLACPASGVFVRPVSVLDYIFALDTLPSVKVLARVVAKDNAVRQYSDPSYTWLSTGGGFNATSLSDHQARTATLTLVAHTPTPAPTLVTSGGGARLLGGGCPRALAAYAYAASFVALALLV